jgi:hypothetical protein
MQEGSDNQVEIQDHLARIFDARASIAEKKNLAPKVLLCDAGFGFPTEARPRREKILAVAKQLVNFLAWQDKAAIGGLAQVIVAGCNEESRSALSDRMTQLWKGELPAHVSFSTLNVTCFDSSALYLSPDSDDALDPAVEPPNVVVVGLLVDRRIKPNRSKIRASSLCLESARLPLGSFDVVDKNEPFNVDTVLVAIQQWWWNNETTLGGDPSECYMRAMEMALVQHGKRHPNRPLHKVTPC